MNGRLHRRIYVHHGGVQIRMILHQSGWIPSASDKDRVDAAAKRRGKNVADLQADEKGECVHHCATS